MTSFIKRVCLFYAFIVVQSTAYGQDQLNRNIMNDRNQNLACKLTTPELQERKRTVIAELKKLVLDKSETSKGIKLKFDGSDRVIDLLTSFIKTERLCCEFFTFDLSVGDANSFVWLELSGPEGARDFIETEMGF